MSSIKTKTISAAALVLFQAFCPVQQNWLPSAYATDNPQNLVAHNVSFTVTSANKRLAESEHRLHWIRDSKSANSKNKSKVAVDANSITIDSNKRFQKVLGFGAAFTDAACYNLNLMPDEARQKLFTELFAQDQLGLNVCRTCMGSSDYSTKVYSYDDGEVDPQLKRFSIATDKEYILPILRQATKINPELYLFATPWSPPGWMKAGHSMLGGNMRKEFMSSYANYFVKYLQAYKAEGVAIGAVTVQNEVDTDQDGRMPACSWPQESETDFTVLHLGPALKKANLDTKIWLIDHNYNLWGRAIGELETPDVRKFASGIAWHGYLGDVSKMTRVHDAFPDINMYWTEGGPDYTAKNYSTDWAKWSQDFTEIFRNWSKSVTAWNLALDEAGKPNLGPFPCGGVVTIDSKTHEVSRSGQYYAIAQFSKFVKRDAVRIDSQSDCAGLQHVAFQNPTGQFVLIVTNSGDPRLVHIVASGEVAECQLDKDSVTTFVWQ